MMNLNTTWLSIGSLVLGLVAWILPVLAIVRYQKESRGPSVLLVLLSISACAISLWFQISYTHFLVSIQDWTALLDTTGTLNRVSAVLLIVTFVLNGAYLFYAKNQGLNHKAH